VLVGLPVVAGFAGGMDAPFDLDLVGGAHAVSLVEEVADNHPRWSLLSMAALPTYQLSAITPHFDLWHSNARYRIEFAEPAQALQKGEEALVAPPGSAARACRPAASREE
jgi:hypothetical protein